MASSTQKVTDPDHLTQTGQGTCLGLPRKLVIEVGQEHGLLTPHNLRPASLSLEISGDLRRERGRNLFQEINRLDHLGPTPP